VPPSGNTSSPLPAPGSTKCVAVGEGVRHQARHRAMHLRQLLLKGLSRSSCQSVFECWEVLSFQRHRLAQLLQGMNLPMSASAMWIHITAHHRAAQHIGWPHSVRFALGHSSSAAVEQCRLVTCLQCQMVFTDSIVGSRHGSKSKDQAAQPTGQQLHTTLARCIDCKGAKA